MGVGLWLSGSHGAEDADALLAGLRSWFEDTLADDGVWGELPIDCRVGTSFEGDPTLFVGLHLACEDVEIRAAEPGRVIVSAKTSTAGAGYHTALCQILRRMGDENGLTWEAGGEDGEGSHDQTGYFFGGGRDAVEAAMLQQLGAMAEVVAENLALGHGGVALGMPMSHAYEGGPIKTPVGVRDGAWLARVREDARNGIDLFPWWDDGLGAGYLMGRAVCEMAANVRWQRATYDTEPHDALEEIHRWLCRAYRLDPTLAYPWREWAEMLGCMEWTPQADICAEVRRRAAAAPDGPLIGYRRHPVQVSLAGGWRITVPGVFEEEWKDGTWSAWAGGRTVWFTAWSFRREDDSIPDAAATLERAALDEEGEALTHADGPVRGRGVIRPYEEDGGRMWNLKAYSAVAGSLALCNVFYPDEPWRDWALAQWRALTHPGAAAEGQ